ncbi:efflux RND transporter periplasmic adaptor subunit [Sphingomonas sp. AP4-R1]|uniref:efflux RND transporter periplasmic adaptor subunit n=1 Tax=Sphingomonas sp. AP4-R1 TaxID=2735134 RepID=UPI00149371B6|nr:efflux RND transporter periplasmic adaptor subunit [Sphingomonas sp. AP4-R1]QJU59389.1 efflux RND transporter periplasmic adaptor subunit [Sphingomonas sp. AP4-R1]
MNMESGIGGSVADYEALDPARSRRKLIIALVAVVIVAIAIGYYVSHRKPKAAGGDSALQRVTYIVPGRSEIAASTRATGTIGARRDQPVGIAGEGGVVRSVLVEAGDWVKAGQILAIVDRSVQTQQAAAMGAQIDQSRADAALALANLNRAKKLVSNGFVSQADIDSKQAALDSANARVAVAQAQLGQQRALIGRLDIRAPAAGLVLTRTVEAGQIVGAASGALFRIAEDGRMEVQARIAESDLAHMAVGNPAIVTPVGTALKIEGKIWQISPVIDPNSRQGTVRVALPFRTELRPGGFASIDLGGSPQELPLLPESAVLSDPKGNFVYVVGSDNRVSRRDVTVGGVDDRGVSIASGLIGRERVIASAGAFLNPGDKVTPVLAGH